MAVPKRKTSPSRRNMRRAHDSLPTTNVIVNKDGDYTLPHRICLKTGMYKGKQVLGKKASAAGQEVATTVEPTVEPSN